LFIKRSRVPRSVDQSIKNFEQLKINQSYIATRISPKLTLTYIGQTAAQVHAFKRSGLISGVMPANSAAQLASWGLTEIKES
jgi:hypothetical protein